MLDLTMPSKQHKRAFSIVRATRAEPAAGAIRLARKKDLERLKMPALVELHNSFVEGLPVQGFDDREDAIEKTWALVSEEVLRNSPYKESEMNAAEKTERTQRRARKSATKKSASKATKKSSRKSGKETPTVASVVRMLERKNGATKEQLIEGVPDAKPGYITALLTRILREKGYKVTSESVEGQRGKVYKIIGRPPSVEVESPAAE